MRCKTDGLAEERIEKWIHHSIEDAHDAERVIDEPSRAWLNVKVELIEKENPIWQTKHDKYTHEHQNDFEHSHLSSIPLVTAIVIMSCRLVLLMLVMLNWLLRNCRDCITTRIAIAKTRWISIVCRFPTDFRRWWVLIDLFLLACTAARDFSTLPNLTCNECIEGDEC